MKLSSNLARTIHDCLVRPVGRSLWAACRSSRPAGLFSFGLLGGLPVRRGACPTSPFVTRRRRCGQIQGRRPEADPRFTFHASRFDKAHRPEPSRGTVHGSWKRAEHDADGRGSFAAVERSMSDRLLGRPYVREAPAGFGLERLATAFMNNPG